MTEKEFISWLGGYLQAFKRTNLTLTQEDLDLIVEKIEEVKNGGTPSIQFFPGTGGFGAPGVPNIAPLTNPMQPYCGGSGTVLCGGATSGSTTTIPSGTTVTYTTK